MNFPKEAVDIVNALYGQHLDLAKGSDDQRRGLTRLMAEQLAFSLGPRWGCKKADSGRPQSKDSLAYADDPADDDTFFWNWDWQNGASRSVQVKAGDEGGRFTDTEPEGAAGQKFIRVTATDHLGTGAQQGSDQGGDAGETQAQPSVQMVDLSPLDLTLKMLHNQVMERLDSLEQATERQYADIVNNIKAMPQPVVPNRAQGRLLNYIPVDLPLVRVPESRETAPSDQMTLDEGMALAKEVADPDFLEKYRDMKIQLANVAVRDADV